MPKPYQPKTGAPCSCKRGIERDNCPACEGTGQRIDFAAIRARSALIRSMGLETELDIERAQHDANQ